MHRMDDDRDDVKLLVGVEVVMVAVVAVMMRRRITHAKSEEGISNVKGSCRAKVNQNQFYLDKK